jgi:hypothetical protein
MLYIVSNIPCKFRVKSLLYVERCRNVEEAKLMVFSVIASVKGDAAARSRNAEALTETQDVIAM